MTVAGRRALTAALGVPWVAGQATRLARRLAGRHSVAAVGVLIADGDVLLVRRAVRGDSWALPGGWVRRREDPAAACVREIREETGLVVEVESLVGYELHAIGGIPLSYGGITLAFACRRAELERDATVRSIELLDAAWHPPAVARELLTDFERGVVDAADRRLRS